MTRRVVLAVTTIALLASGCTVDAVDSAQPGCDTKISLFVLMAQAVPSATIVPCVEGFPEGWTYGGSKTSSGEFHLFLDSDRAGLHAVEVVLTSSCDRGPAVEVLPAADETGMRRFEEPIELPPNFRANRYYTFPGGCIEVRYRFAGTADPALVLEADQVLGFVRREQIVAEIAKEGFVLCGADAPPCAGETGPENG